MILIRQGVAAACGRSAEVVTNVAIITRPDCTIIPDHTTQWRPHPDG